MLDKRDLFFSFLPLAAPLVALGVAGGIALLSRPDVAPTPAFTAEPSPAVISADAQGLQLVAEATAAPPAFVPSAAVVDPVAVADPVAAGDPAAVDDPAIVTATAAPAASEPSQAEPRAVAVEPPLPKPRLAGKTAARRVKPTARRQAALSRPSSARRTARPDKGR